jgi:hypothetical protein
MKSKIFAGVVFMCAIAIAYSAVAKSNAQSNQGNSDKNKTVNSNSNAAKETAVTSDQTNGNTNQNKKTNQDTSQDSTGGKNSSDNNQGQVKKIKTNLLPAGQENADAHRSVVSSFVKVLLNVAKNEETSGQNTIGSQVRTIAMQQNVAEATTVTAMETVETRNPFKTFLFGADYKNLGQLRSEMVHTRNRIKQLTRLMGSVQDETAKTALQDQITSLQTEQTNINTFITDNQDKFSLFGWVFKLFGPTPTDDTGDDTDNTDIGGTNPTDNTGTGGTNPIDNTDNTGTGTTTP